MGITTKDIQDWAEDTVSYARGVSYHKQNKVANLHISIDPEEDIVVINATAKGSEPYDVTIHLSNKALKACYCECPAHQSGRYYICKHVVATLLEFLDIQSEMEEELMDFPVESLDNADENQSIVADRKQTDPEIIALMQMSLKPDIADIQSEDGQGQMALDMQLHIGPGISPAVSLKVGSKKMLVVPNIDNFLYNVREGLEASYGKSLKFVHHPQRFGQIDQALIAILQHQIKDQNLQERTRNAHASWGYSSYGVNFGKILPLSSRVLDDIINLYRDQEIQVHVHYNYSYKIKGDVISCRVKEGFPPLNFFMKKNQAGNFEFGSKQITPILGAYGKNHYYWLYEEDLYCSPINLYHKIEALLEALMRTRKPSLTIDRRDLRAFFALNLQEVEPYIELDMDPKEKEEYQPYPLDSGIYLDINEEGDIEAKVTFLYGEHQVSPMESIDERGIRNIKEEIPIMKIIGRFFPYFDEEKQVFETVGEEGVAFLLEEGVSAMEAVSVVYASDTFQKLMVQKPVKPVVHISSSGGILDVELSLEGFTVDDILHILQQYKVGKKYTRLRSGQFLRLEKEEIEDLEALTQDLELESLTKKEKMSQDAHYHLQLPLPRVLSLREDIQKRKNTVFSETKELKNLAHTIASSQESEIILRDSLETILRPYQKEGVKWLNALRRCEMGGILADDMGLGKTLQIIALLDAYYAQESDRPSLVVCPTSLVLNWGQEFMKFAPELKVLLVLGKKEERQELISRLNDHQVIVTSYDVLKRDAKSYENREFAFHILDEAQYIKNQFTKNARSVKGISSLYRFALTGTPMENYISELWSIFDFLMPGYLYNHRKFQGKFETPIQKKKDDKALHALKRLVSPFVLRRMKKDVLTDLPEKMESTRYLEMDEEQEQLYKSHAALLVKELRKQLEEEGLEKSKILVLSMITKLRQICCHPSLCFENYYGGSIKLEAATELIQSAKENGHKLLVFSQFTSMLSLVEKELQKLNMDYHLLTGSTPAAKRMQMANSFNKDDVPVFLISLKAGGTGLNLTGADIVLHLDPWWNVAAQNQATDRAHRIGQVNKVQVYKLIAKGTIEEKIQELQSVKADLANNLLGESSGSFTSMAAEDILALFSVGE